MESTTNTSWPELGLSAELLELLEKTGYKNPSAVQAQAIPMALKGLDVLVSSPTGSGKTASFVIPVIERFKGKNGTYILALSPTREIAQQTGAVFEAFGKPFGLKVAVCIGGASISEEKEALSKSPHIIVATPGRLCDHLERGNIWLDFIQCLIFDEADRMLEMGFAKQIDMITEQIPKERQTLMLSATFAAPVEKLARKSMNDPQKVVIEKTAETKPKIDERIFWLDENKKLTQLMRLLREEKGTVFVFVNAKERSYQVWRSLQSKGFMDVTYIHSDLPQDARELAVADFKSGKYTVIVATDVMGRGIDVDDVAHVVNYDVPREAADYIHRIGRTGRRGLTGHATTFAIPGKDDRSIKEIQKIKGTYDPKAELRPAPAPREERPRQPQRSREQHPRSHQSRPQSQHQNSRPVPLVTPAQRPPSVVQTPKAPEVSKAQELSFLQKVLGFFSKKV